MSTKIEIKVVLFYFTIVLFNWSGSALAAPVYVRLGFAEIERLVLIHTNRSQGNRGCQRLGPLGAEYRMHVAREGYALR
jgi:hypothetical protein